MVLGLGFLEHACELGESLRGEDHRASRVGGWVDGDSREVWAGSVFDAKGLFALLVMEVAEAVVTHGGRTAAVSVGHNVVAVRGCVHVSFSVDEFGR
jgi:hypothetical protein